jgi:3'(2'), 5'-bisphosphate nucleotidase
LTVNVTHDLIAMIRALALTAGAEIMKIYDSKFEVETKADASPVTQADRLAESIIIDGIRGSISERFPIVAEEAASGGDLPDVSQGPFWLIDPLDGTKQFIKHEPEFTVNIALIDAGRPIVGAVFAPAHRALYVGSALGAFAETDGGEARRIACKPVPAKGVTVAVSSSHRSAGDDAFLAKLDVKKTISAGSSLKFCLVAEGKADVYPRFGTTMEWDTAAGHAVLRFAGGHMTHVDGSEFLYNKPDFRNPHFIAWGAEPQK